jgi:hypothetical protein
MTADPLLLALYWAAMGYLLVSLRLTLRGIR